jgi:hypothetical protein
MIGINSLRLPALALTATMLWGCGAGPAAAPWYQSPPGFTAATGATVSMSSNPDVGGDPDGDTRVTTVDGQTVSPMEFDKVVLPPGDHTLGVQYNGASQVASVVIRAVFRPGVNYAVKGQNDGSCAATLWLEDQSTNKALGDRLETHLTAKPNSRGSSVFAVACN